ncbi:MAG TPA: hypothetical protein VGX24_16975 [Pyrinomonadaceae bacterium]|jgi:hypothetical protein|nr:hypothetical protein [Pyrinomonadaceae bacterium]
MRKDNSTRTSPARAQREPSFDEPIRRWANLPITQDRARELVDLITRREDRDSLDALIELICGLMPYPPSDDMHDLDERSLAGHAALWHAFADTTRAGNELGAYVVGLKCAEWE